MRIQAFRFRKLVFRGTLSGGELLRCGVSLNMFSAEFPFLIALPVWPPVRRWWFGSTWAIGVTRCCKVAGLFEVELNRDCSFCWIRFTVLTPAIGLNCAVSGLCFYEVQKEGLIPEYCNFEVTFEPLPSVLLDLAWACVIIFYASSGTELAFWWLILVTDLNCRVLLGTNGSRGTIHCNIELGSLLISI